MVDYVALDDGGGCGVDQFQSADDWHMVGLDQFHYSNFLDVGQLAGASAGAAEAAGIES
jgi:hypothetical protein